jgi:membrane protein DedA with SNARE-associated domain
VQGGSIEMRLLRRAERRGGAGSRLPVDFGHDHSSPTRALRSMTPLTEGARRKALRTFASVVAAATAITAVVAFCGLVVANLALDGFAHEGWTTRQSRVVAAVVLPLMAAAAAAAVARRRGDRREQR